jgi:hypothetical protein
MSARQQLTAALLCAGCLATNAMAQQPYAQQPAAKGAASADAVIRAAAARPTPRVKAGHADLGGYWTTAIARNPAPQVQQATEVSADGKTIQLGIAAPQDVRAGEIGPVAQRRARSDLRPPYRPEFAAKVLELFDHANTMDPTARCAPPGVPRIGMPAEIVQTGDAVYLLYATRNYFRIIPTDGRPHDADADAMNMGDPIGRWEGNTLIVESLNFNEDTWLDRDGTFHSTHMKVTERFTRRGDTLTYAATVEDPDVLTGPWSPPTQTLVLGQRGQHIAQDYPCIERDVDHYVNSNRH